MTHTPDHGSPRLAVVIEDIAVGSAATIRRARVADPLDRIATLEPQHRAAARIYRQAAAHVAAGKGMGPLPYGRDHPPTNGAYGLLCAQERAVTAAEWLRRGTHAMGVRAATGIVAWVVLNEQPLDAWDAGWRLRKGTGSADLLDALGKLAAEYGA